MHLIPELLDDADQLTTEPAVHDTNLFGDIPRPIWIAFLSAWGLLFGLFLLFFTTDAPSTLAVVTASFRSHDAGPARGARQLVEILIASMAADHRDPQRPASNWCRRHSDPPYPVRSGDRSRAVRVAGTLDVPRRGSCPRS